MIGNFQFPAWVVMPCETGWSCEKIQDDGSMTTYKFQTKEWAQLCADSFNRLDERKSQGKWGISLTSISHPYQNGTTASMRELTMTQFDLENLTIFALDHNRQVVKFDVPAIIYLWLKTTWIPKAWKRLMWGEKGKK